MFAEANTGRSTQMVHNMRLLDGWMDGWVDGWMDDGWMDGWVDDGWMMDGWVVGWIDGWVKKNTLRWGKLPLPQKPPRNQL